MSGVGGPTRAGPARAPTVIVAVLAVAWWLVLAPGMPPQPGECQVVHIPAGGQLRARVQVGIGGRFMLGAWTPVTVSVENQGGRDWAGEVRVVVTRGSRVRQNVAATTYSRPAFVDAGARRDLAFVVPIDQVASPLEVWSVSGAQISKLASADLRHMASEHPLLIRVDDPSALPASPLALDGVAVVEIGGFGAAELSSERFRSLCVWVAFGGVLAAHWPAHDVATAVVRQVRGIGAAAGGDKASQGSPAPARAPVRDGPMVQSRLSAGLGEVLVLNRACPGLLTGRPDAEADAADLVARGFLTRRPEGPQLFPAGGSQRALTVLGSLPFYYSWDREMSWGVVLYALLVASVCLLAARATRSGAPRRAAAGGRLPGMRSVWALCAVAAAATGCAWVVGTDRIPGDTTFVARLQLVDAVAGYPTAWLRDFTSAVSLVPRQADTAAPHPGAEGVRPLEAHPLTGGGGTGDFVTLSPAASGFVDLDGRAYRGYEVRSVTSFPVVVTSTPAPWGVEVSVENRSSLELLNCQLFVGGVSRVLGRIGAGGARRVAVRYDDIGAAMPNDAQSASSPPPELVAARSYREGVLLAAAYDHLMGLPVSVVRPPMSMMDHLAESRLLRVRTVPGPKPVPDTRALGYLVGQVCPPVMPPLRLGIPRNSVEVTVFRLAIPIHRLMDEVRLRGVRAGSAEAAGRGSDP